MSESLTLNGLLRDVDASSSSLGAYELPARLQTLAPPAFEPRAAADDNWFLRSAKEYARDKATGERIRVVLWWVSGLSLLLNCVLACCLTYLASTVKVVPYIVQVDEHGYSVPIKEPPTSSIDDPRVRNVITHDLSEWLYNFRAVVSDPTAQQVYMRRVYARTPAGTLAHAKVEEWYDKHSPLGVKGRTVETRVTNLQSISDAVWQVEWVERERVGGQDPKTAKFSGTLTIAFSPTSTLEDIQLNALGVYITDLSWRQAQAAR